MYFSDFFDHVGISTGRIMAAVLAVALGAVSAFLSFRAWHRVGGDVSLASVKRQYVVTAVSEAWRTYWKSALFIASFYCLNLVPLSRYGCSCWKDVSKVARFACECSRVKE